MERPDFIKHYTEIQEPDSSHYKNSDELLSIGSPFGKKMGLRRLGIHHELLPPGRRTSWPHAESTEEEFVYVIEGNPQGWIDGHLYDLKPGDGVGFPPGTGIAHTFINNTHSDVRLLVAGDTNREDNKCFYPLHPERNKQIGDFCWKDSPKHNMGPHDGLPDRLRESRNRNAVFCEVEKEYRAAYSIPIKLRTGEKLHSFLEKPTEWDGWLWCTSKEGISGWVPKNYLKLNGSECEALTDYDATEVTVQTGERLRIEKEESGWLWCSTEDGMKGWVPKRNIRVLAGNGAQWVL